MKNVMTFIGTIILFSIIVLVLYKLLYKFVLSKIKVNKWIILAIAMIEFIVPPVLLQGAPMIVMNYIVPGIFVILILWFLDLSGFMKHYETKEKKENYYKYTGSNKKKDVVIKPKAKPNRVKHNENK